MCCHAVTNSMCGLGTQANDEDHITQKQALNILRPSHASALKGITGDSVAAVLQNYLIFASCTTFAIKPRRTG